MAPRRATLLSLAFLKSLEGSRFYAYDYSRHGQDWTMGQCSSRARQSPVDFAADAAGMPAASNLPYRYQPIEEAFELQNNGRTYSADLSAMGYGGVAHEDAWYDLMNLNVHAMSEHTFAGQHFPAELHLVHKRYDGDALLVVAVPLVSPSGSSLLQRSSHVNSSRRASFLQRQEVETYQAPPEGDAGFNAMVQSFLTVALPPPHGSIQVPAEEANPLDLNILLQGGSFLEYAGSMTAPPCAEIVTWLVRSQPLMASDMQVRALVDGVYATTGGTGNYRSVMPLGGRSLVLRTAMFEELPQPPGGTDGVTVGSGSAAASTGAAAATATIANEALRVAQNATQYAAALEGQLQAEANAEASAGALPCTTTPPADLGPVVQAVVAAATQEIIAAANASALNAANAAVDHVKSHLMSTPPPSSR